MPVRILSPADVPSFRSLRLAGLQRDPAFFASSYEDEKNRSVDELSARLIATEDRAVFGAFDGGRLAGIAGVYRHEPRKYRHKAHLWGVYVDPLYRGAGIGSALLSEAIGFARAMHGVTQLNLTVSAANPTAIRLYRSLGFDVFGEEPDSLFANGALHDELHMALRFAKPRPENQPLNGHGDDRPSSATGSAMSPAIAIRTVEASQAMACVDALADVLIDCVEGGASVSFLLPIERKTAVEFWTHVAESVMRNERLLLVAEDPDGRIVGTVQLITALPENQRHRADVAKMLVRRDARRRGIATLLMTAIDDAARRAGKSVLVLDTVTGGEAERLYERSGWQRVGHVPNYALTPDGRFCGTTFFHKQLPPRPDAAGES